MNTTSAISVPPKSLSLALSHVASGGRLCVATPLRVWVIDAKTLERWDRSGMALLREEGDGYRMQNGRRSVYLLPGQLTMID